MPEAPPIFIWKKAPFTRLLAALIAGILFEYYLAFPIAAIVSAFLFITISLLVVSKQKIATRYSLLALNGFLWLSLFVMIGIGITYFANVKNNNQWHGHSLTDTRYWKVRIGSPPEAKARTFKVTAETVSAYSNDGGHDAVGNVLLYLSKDSNSSRLQQGDVLIVRNKLHPIKFSGNPGTFDYSKYMADRQIYFQAYLQKEDWQLLQRGTNTTFQNWIDASLEYENRIFEKYVKGEREIALAKALITGNRADLDKDLIQAYGNAGVVHIMSISGLHIGLIYLFLLQIVKVIPGIAGNKFAKAALILVGIWFFAVLTGCSPSVLRSAVMFSCLLAGTLINRKISTYNFWSASAFILLCTNPFLLWHVGFQLSYLAVLGILVAQKPIYHWFTFQNKIMDYCWQLISVSIAAQLFTLPVCMYYFHQIPLLFLIANLVAIPLSSIGLWLSLILIIAGALPFLPVWIGSFVTVVYRWLNDFILYIDSFTYTSWNEIYPSVGETICLFIIILSTIHWLLRKSKFALRLVAAGIFFLTLSFTRKEWRASAQRRLIVYNLSSTTAIDILSGNKYFEVFETAKNGLGEKNTMQIARKFYKANIPDSALKKVVFHENTFYPEASLLILKSKNYNYNFTGKKIHINAILLSDAEGVRIADLNKIFDAGLYIFSPLNKGYQIEKWKKDCEDLHLRSHDIATEGAVVANY